MEVLAPPSPQIITPDASSSFKVSTVAIVIVAAMVNALILGISLRVIVLRYRRDHRLATARMLDQEREAARNVRRTPIQRITPTVVLHPGSAAPSMGLKQARPSSKDPGVISHWTTEGSMFFSVDVQRALTEVQIGQIPPGKEADVVPASRPQLRGLMGKSRSQAEGADPKQLGADGSDAV